ncbi:uncharacterized protein EHS24_008484 [Apiotrichum porosum]|uniref:CENP-V/GFA domain-containing protein n=1 Tax=Apiotrichum porosum TaxID=105984 RepID=A0A427XQF0_9TREE|nr:uncharacterized protein EHS24_008484 [Apiotrichum porosum]RSH81050.1 hypothetical protein EHS24_008484 [Apiotrichum porosum]
MATASGNPGWINGSCNCGKITVSLKPPSDGLHVCHCIDCRKFTGAIAAFLLQLPAADFKIEGEYRTWNTIGNTGLKVGRYFCGECGS